MTLRLKQLGACMALAASALMGATGAQAAEQKVLNIYNWSDYIAEDTIKNFEKETGIKVRYDNFDSNEMLHAKLVAGKTGYDIVVPGAHFAKTQIEGGLLQKLDKSKLTNWGNLDKGILEQMAKLDPNNEHLVDWMWGYVTVGINVDKVKKALGDTPLPENVWSLLFDTQYVSKLKSCGVSVLDSASEVVPIAMMYAGKPPFSKDEADYKAAGAALKAIRPYVTRFSSSGYIEEMASGATCLVMGFSGDINIARARAAETKVKNKAPVVIEALVPKSGATMYFDSMAIPKDAKNVENAHLFINYILRPEVHASLTNKVFYANPNAASLKFVKKDVAENKTIFLEPAVAKVMVPAESLPQALRKVQTRTFTNFKAGR
ncbi:MAG: polyamine ABC transporter substrate-binding protein [Burkholderiales bacterium]|nr:polyamine ABC transporter substrate-binding protein [Burkholderiales bacterium]